MKLNIIYAATLFLATSVPGVVGQTQPPTGSEGGSCYPDSTCDSGLACICGVGICTPPKTVGENCFSCDALCLSGICDSDSTCAAPPVTDPCQATVNCGSGGKCISGSATDATCVCENTFELTEDSKGSPTCACPSGTTFNADANRCFAPPTMAPTKAPTVAPTASPTASPTSAPTAEEEDLCEDDLTQTFALDIGKDVSCDWILKNKKKSSKRKAKYCVREEVMNMCPVSCDACSS